MKVIIQPFQETWAATFQQYRQIILDALLGLKPAIEHIGSTSVPGLGAKPIIDIQVGLASEADLDRVIAPMQQSGFTYFRKYTPEWPERRFFIKLEATGAAIRPVVIDVNDDDTFRQHFKTLANIHTFVKGTDDWIRHLAFRDFLRAHADVRDAYFQLKNKLTEKEFKDIIDYNNHKNDFVKSVEKQALVWYGEQQQEKNGNG